MIDENGDFYFVNTVDKKGFIAFAKLYQKVHDIAFWGNYPVVLQDNRLAIVDYKNGSVWSEVAERFDKCAVSGDSIYCSGDGYFSVISAQTGKISKRYAFKDGVFAVVDVEKAKAWIAKGVQPTETVRSLLLSTGVIEKSAKLSPAKTNPKKKKK